MLAAGEAFVRAHGLSLSLEHLSMEDLIRDADVSRTSSYRRWPSKDQFASDLLVRLSEGHIVDDLSYLADSLSDLPAELLDRLDSAAGRHDLLVEIVRRTMVDDFTTTADSPQWRAYITLRAAHIGLPPGDLRDEVAAGLRDTERAFTRQRAHALASMMSMAGYRLREPDTFEWEQISLTISAIVTGMIVRAYSDPETVTAERAVAPFGTSRVATWNSAALASASVLLGVIEPDPDVIWGATRLANLRTALANMHDTVKQLWNGALNGTDSAWV